MSRLRLFPILLFAAALLLSVKLGDLWSLIGGDGAATGDPAAVAQVAPARAQDSDDEEADPADEDGDLTEEDPLSGVPEELGDDLTPMELEEKDVPALVNEDDVSPAEMRLIHDLAARRALLEERERRLDERDAVLAAAEIRLQEKQQQLEFLKRDIEDLIKKFDGIQDEQTSALRETYEKMKPKSAAAIFNDLDLETTMSVVRGIAPRRLAPILQAMDPERARVVTQELNRRETLPDVPQ